MSSVMSRLHGRGVACVVWILAAGALAGAAGCSSAAGASGTPGPQSTSTAGPTSSGRLLDAHDAQGHRYREVPGPQAPGVDLVVRPGGRDGWDLHLTLHRFRLSPAGDDGRRATPGRGWVRLFLDGRPLAVLHTTRYHLPARLLSRGTHQLTARLLADDGTVWAVDGRPVENTAALTASKAPAGSPPEPSAGTPRGEGAR